MEHFLITELQPSKEILSKLRYNDITDRQTNRDVDADKQIHRRRYRQRERQTDQTLIDTGRQKQTDTNKTRRQYSAKQFNTIQTRLILPPAPLWISKSNNTISNTYNFQQQEFPTTTIFTAAISRCNINSKATANVQQIPQHKISSHSQPFPNFKISSTFQISRCPVTSRAMLCITARLYYLNKTAQEGGSL